MPERCPRCDRCERCIRCGAPLTRDETALTKKLINRGAREFLCYGCLAAHFQVGVDALHRKVAEFREMGCTLFEASVD